MVGVSADVSDEMQERVRALLRDYRRSLKGDRRHLFDSYRFVDMARKVVGVGSVGRRCSSHTSGRALSGTTESGWSRASG